MISDFHSLKVKKKKKKAPKQADKIYILNTKESNLTDKEIWMMVEMKLITLLPTISHEIYDERRLPYNQNIQVEASHSVTPLGARIGDRSIFILGMQ